MTPERREFLLIGEHHADFGAVLGTFRKCFDRIFGGIFEEKV